MSGPWEADIETILNDHAPVAAEPPTTRELMMMAWQYGYTTGLADSAKFEQALMAAGGGHTISIQGPIEYPGGKNGMFVAHCSCGEYASAIGSEDEVRLAGGAHVHAKRRSQR